MASKVIPAGSPAISRGDVWRVFQSSIKMTFINVKVKALWKVNIKVDWWPSFSSQGFLLQLCQSYQINVAFSFLDLRWTACFAIALEHLMLQKKKLQTWAKNWWDYTCVAKVTRVTVILRFSSAPWNHLHIKSVIYLLWWLFLGRLTTY